MDNPQREIIGEYLKFGSTQNDVADRIGIHQSNVQKALAGSTFMPIRKLLAQLQKYYPKLE